MNLQTRSLVQLVVVVVATALVAWAFSAFLGSREPDPPGATEGAGTPATTSSRIVSLSPGITEVLLEIGSEGRLVGISDYCALPSGHAPLPRLGTALTPSYEGILGVRPDLILTQEARDTPIDELGRLAPTVSLPWHTSEDLIRSIEEVGRRTGAVTAAQTLAARVDATLRGAPPTLDAPRVLFVLEHSAGQLTEAWYVKDDTIHGDALRAAGVRNAIPPGDPGVPRLSLERVVAIDPDAILILSTRDTLPAAEKEQLLDDWRQLTTLRAVHRGAIAVVTGDRLYVTGPRVLELVEAIREALVSLALEETAR